jgi:translocation protein SEC66
MFSVSLSALAPIAYLGLVLGSLGIFSSIYRRRKAQESSNIEPWFPNHPQRDVYLTLLHIEDPPCAPTLLKSALFQRATEDVARIYSLREAKMAAANLLQKGSISESTFQQINAAEAEMNVECQDVISEARALGGAEWGETILAQANEAYQKQVILKSIEKAERYAEEKRSKWDENQLILKEEQDRQREIALKELTGEDGNVSGQTANGDVKATDVESNGGLESQGHERKGKKKKNKK